MWRILYQSLNPLVVQSRLVNGQVEIVVHAGRVCGFKVSPRLTICSQGHWDMSASHAALQSLDLSIFARRIHECAKLICDHLLDEHGHLIVEVVNSRVHEYRIVRQEKGVA